MSNLSLSMSDHTATKRMGKLSVFLFTCLAIPFLAVKAQTPSDIEKIPPPTPPFLNPAPETSAWIITVTPPASSSGFGAKPSPKQLKQIQVTKAGDTRREVSVLNDGTATEDWFYKGVHLVFDKNADYAVAIDPYASAKSAPPAAEIDFYDFSWINASDFIGKTSRSGQVCYYFIHQFPTRREEAWINAQTKLPVAIRSELRQWEYQFTASSESSLTIPPVFQAAYDLHKKQLENAKRIQANMPP
jgi:hypothetical protein